MKTSPRAVVLLSLAVAAILTLASGCGTKGTGRSILITAVGDRQIKASLDGGSSSISGHDGAAFITFSGGNLVVEKSRILLDDKEVAKVPEDATHVEIDYTAGTLTATADGVNVLTTKLTK